jgi:MFS family permease
MLLADLVRALLLLCLPLAFLCGLLNITLIYLVTILLGICTICFDTASQAFLLQIIADDCLLEANSKMASSASLAEIGGPPLAGGLVQLIGAPLAVVFDALSFLLSALSIGLIRAHEIQHTPLTSEHSSVWREIALGLHVLREQALLYKLACYATVQTFCGGAFAALYTIFVVRELGLAPVLYGVLVALGGVGALIGSLILPWFNRRWGIQRTLVSGTILHGTLALVTPFVSGPILLVFAILGLSQLFGDIGYQLFAISEISLRQNCIPVQMQGRVNAVMIFLIGGVAPFGILLASIVCLFIGVRLTLLCGASGMLLSALGLGFVLRKEAK